MDRQRALAKICWVSVWIIVAVLKTWAGTTSDTSGKILVLTEDMSGEFIGDYFSYYKDHAYEWSFQDASSPGNAGKYVHGGPKRSNYGNEELAQWNKLVLTNATEHEWLLDVSVYTLDSLNFYYPDAEGKYRVIREGRSKPFRDKVYKSNSFLFALSVAPGDTITVYLEVCAFIMQYPTQVFLKEDFIETAHSRDLITGLFAGIILIMFFYNLFIWFSIRDISYLYYAIYAFFSAVFTFEMNGLLSELIYDGPWVKLSIHGPLIVAVSNLSAVLFTMHFLETRTRTGGIDKVFRYFLIPLSLIICILDLTGMKLQASLMNQSVGILIILVSLPAAYYAHRSGLHSVRYFILAKVFVFLGIIFFVLKTFAIFNYSVLTNRAIELGLSLETIFFSFALGDKINKYKKDKEAAVMANQKLMAEQNIVLEETVKKRTHELSLEKEKSDSLLLNILPQDIADELKNTGGVKARVYDSISILFSDFQNFTKISSGLEASKLIEEINVYFKKFDQIAVDYQVEKIKTIGDAYMAASGFSGDSVAELKRMIHCALRMQEFVDERAKEHQNQHYHPFEMRIGIHIGPVVAGVVGHKKFQYDLWGDTVNTAARMESNGEVGKVNISEEVYMILKDDPEFDMHFRGALEVKGKGVMRMYFISRAN